MSDRFVIYGRAGEILDQADERSRETCILDLRAAYEAEIGRGMTYLGKPLQIDEGSMQRMSATGALLGADLPLPAGFAWRMGDNTALPMDRAAFLAMAAAAFAHVNGLRQRLWRAVDAARAAPDAAAARGIAF